MFLFYEGSDILGKGFLAHLQSFIDFLIFIGIFAGIVLAVEYNYGFILMSVFAIIILFYSQRRQKEKQRALYMENIKRQWGKEHKQKRNLLHIKKMYEYFQGKDKDSFVIDSITWEDLNMDSVFEKIDHTMTLPGMQYLYNILKRPVFHNGILERRSKNLGKFSQDKELCQTIQEPLFLLGKEEGKDIFDYFNNGINVNTKPLVLYTIVSYLPLGVIGLLFLDTQIAFLALILLITINNLLYQTAKKKVESEMETFRYLISLTNCGERIIKIDTEDLNINKEEIKELLKKINPIRKRMKKINQKEGYMSDTEILKHYINMLILRYSIKL